MQQRSVRLTAWAAVLCASMVATPTGQPSPAAASCDAWLLEPREVRGKRVGPTSCAAQESALSLDGRPYARLDVGVTGTVEGWITRTGDYQEYLTNAPDLVFGQTADPGPLLFAVAAYEREKGAAMTIVHPADPAAWNGKVFVTVHGRGVSFKEGNLKAWDKNLDPGDPLRDLNKYDRLMLAKGYALVKTRRTSAEGLGEIIATLEDGRKVDDVAFNDSAAYVKDFTELAHNILRTRLRQAPRRTYFYGHSAGARIGRGLNYTPGLNTRRDGQVLYDALLLDDAAAGGWLPVVMKDGRDVLFTTDAEKQRFVPQLDVTHQMYNNIWPGQKPPYMSPSYLHNKRQNARLLREKGLGAKARMYEVRSISHSGGESLPDGRRGEIQILDMSRLMDRFIDLLDAWADTGKAPPETRSDWAVLGDADGDGVIEHPALAFPDVACPLGVYYPYPNTRSGTTAFAPFTGEGLEPLDAENVFADMNRNGIWDLRETPTQAWQRLGLLRRGETLTREAYTSCVTQAADRLVQDGFFSPATAAWYVEQAKTADLAPRASR
ncbi:MAG TPA: alpha/beta hydrolase domain-containing protein [Vicinamibacterales bacterium]|nr:alpha/beta hydrolase domain-containing protein [Vicinamibacterales bacterium]